ncbi:hypothetical protein G9464_06630 [Halostella sp. JP-L12]|uniref:hypothetical protein n=1 Tax=Halostella TaxID=1843185 RepID=UPI000EF7C93E|nr:MULTISPECIES: hypothetical protein [Halostella]NHN47273.1 hypothetical protein [Halostella sp. JP-L12]
MSGDEERQWAYAEGLDDDRILDVFEGAAPLPTAAIAERAGVTEQTAAAKLVELADEWRVRRKRPGEGPSVWYRPTSAFGDEPEPTERSVDDAIDALDVPGTSGMMRDWRRDAVRAAFDFLAEEGTVEEPAFREEVYPAQTASYDDPDAWWAMVRPRLRTLPGVDAPTWRSETTWQFDEDAVSAVDET